MPYRPYLLFDAGGTLVFPDQTFLAQQAQIRGVKTTGEQLFAGYCHLIYGLDRHIREQGRFPLVWPQGYTQALFENLGVPPSTVEAISQAVEAHYEQKSLWTFTFSWVAEVLTQLTAQGYRMSVLSNSDGRAAEILSDLGLAPCFERIFDSEILGVEKPHPAIFETALHELNLSPASVLYIGDIFHIDVWGANQAGLGAIHLDPLNLYTGWPGVHLPDIRHLPTWLAQYATAPTAFDLFPAKDLQLNLE